MKFAQVLLSACLVASVAFAARLHAQEKLNVAPPGYTALFNGNDLTGWKGLPLKANMNAKRKEAQPYAAMTMPERLKASPEELAEAQKRGDTGIYVRGTPQIQIWDPFTPNAKTGARNPGSGGDYKNL